ncbi:MAG: HAD hydrolase-like protein [Candidatus Marsarchaeota archaeon]|jgi:phosphoglycolate phosphatase-like HAD superfamily hydrolase|nr:HAD hydrolase-like protein [Candidatus Marsarchaeota archaeon]MCL5111337.1 HAD hydrolase-like protein [Candidatus Marsarchaeota archaeon]
MAGRLVLIDVNNTVVKDQRDVSEYVFEAIRSKYGLEAQFRLEDYDGVPAQLMIADILEKNGVSKEEIDARLESCAEELGYSYYNVTGRDPIMTLEGSKQLLDELAKKGALIGIATGDIEDVIKNKLQRANLSGYFRFGEYGNKETDFKTIVEKAVSRAKSEFGLDSSASVWVLSSYPGLIKGAKSANANAIGVASGRYGRDVLASAGADEIVDSIRERSKIMKTLLKGQP